MIEKQELTLSHSDGKPDAIGLEAVNRILRPVGVRISQVPVPTVAHPILKTSQEQAVPESQHPELISTFNLDRDQLLEQIELAGREAATHRGGLLSTSEHGVAPYPKVYDMRAMDSAARTATLRRFGRLHINSTDEGLGIDEVMTVVYAGPLTWFFQLADGVVGKVSLPAVEIGDPAWRLSYPGLQPHGGFLDAEYGLVVAFAHGPEKFVMRYEHPNVDAEGAELLGTNPWVDFNGEVPRLLDDAIQN
ncbi:hypothetical protein ACFTSF_11360 [Kribbella sp. NPDC056951]|uniref:hypothetical protein n=1 Tax=Kribbella sp. NPDC056951 TaxID=3345978 RepID=UPI00363AEB0D